MSDSTHSPRHPSTSPLEAALAYVEHGWHVLPCKPRDKAAACPNGLYDATVDAAQVNRWWTKNPDHNVAVRCGRISGFVVLDFDFRHGGREALAYLEDRFGPLPDTRVVKTADGLHYYFRCPSGVRVRTVKDFLRDGVEVRGERSYVMAPPSVHPTGAIYEVLTDHQIAAMPQWLIEQIKRQQRRRRPKKKNSSATTTRPTDRPARVIAVATDDPTITILKSDPSNALLVYPSNLTRSRVAVAQAVAHVATERLQSGDSLAFSVGRVAAGRDLIRRTISQQQGTLYDRSTIARSLNCLVDLGVLKRDEEQLAPQRKVGGERDGKWIDGAYVYELVLQVARDLRELIGKAIEENKARKNPFLQSFLQDNLDPVVGCSGLAGALLWAVRFASVGRRHTSAFWLTRRCRYAGLHEDDARKVLWEFYVRVADTTDFFFDECLSTISNHYRKPRDKRTDKMRSPAG